MFESCLLLTQLHPSLHPPPPQPQASSLPVSVSPVIKRRCHWSCRCFRKWFQPQVGGAERGRPRERGKRERDREKESGLSLFDSVRAETCSGGLTLTPQFSPPPPSAVTLEHRGSDGCVVFVSQDSEEPPRPGPRPSDGVLHVCLERVVQLERWLQEAQRSLGAAGGGGGGGTMQDSVEQQLLTCQVSSAHCRGNLQDRRRQTENNTESDFKKGEDL